MRSKSKGSKEKIFSENQRSLDFKAIVELGYDSFLFYKPNGRITYCSPAVKKMAGYENKHMIGKLGTAFIHPKHRALAISKFKESLQKPGKSIVFEIQLIKKSKQIFWAEQALTNLLHKPGVNAVVNTIHNINERRKAQEQIHDSQKFISNVFQVTRAPLFVKNDRHDFVMANEAFSGFLGRPLAEIIGKNDVDFLGPDEIDVFWRVDNEVLRTGKTISNEENVTDKFGDTRRVITTKTRYIDREGNKFVVASIKDITDERRALDELAARNFELDQLMYKTSHDLRSPLASILGLVNLTKIDQANQNLYLEKIEGRAKKLDEFVRSMLDYAKVSRKDAVSEKIELPTVINGCLNELAFLENFNEIRTKTSYKPKAPFNSDPWLIKIIIGNIVSNAYKYYRVDAKSFLKIAVTTSKKEARLVFEDNGIGIKKEHLNKIFDMFYRATDRTEGSGLGMYIVKQAVEKLRGQIQLRSQFNSGTKIIVTIPNLT